MIISYVIYTSLDQYNTIDIIDMSTSESDSLYSRQIYALGKDAMSSLGSANIFISGLSGLGIEIAKCLALTGIHSITLYHPPNMTKRMIGTNYYMDPMTRWNDDEYDVHKFVGDMIISIQELNPNMSVRRMSLITTERLKKFNMVIFCDQNYYDMIHYNNFCRHHNIRFICCKSRGVVGSIISDYGDAMMISDSDGETPVSSEVMEIKDNCIWTMTPHKLYTGDLIRLVRSSDGHDQPTDRNMVDKYLVKVESNRSFFLVELPPTDLSSISPEHITVYASKSPIHAFDRPYHMDPLIVEQQKIPRTYRFTSLNDQLNRPDFVRIDVMDWNRPILLHSITKAIDMVSTMTNGTCDMIDRIGLIGMLVSLDMRMMGRELSDLDNQMIQSIAITSAGILPPVDSIIGSIVSQEVVKVVCGKFTPNHQTLYYDCLDMLPDNYLESRRNDPTDYQRVGDRYDSQRVILGNMMMNRLFDAKLFVVGAGAIGCEHLKNLAMMGVRDITITDMDWIELSNLSRQFLFRKQDIRKPKSITAAIKIQSMNPDIRVSAHENRVSRETSDVYDRKFYDRMDCVLNALDNVEARIFVDERCVEYGKPLLESGTLGTKGNIQTILPHLTESYGSIRDQPEEQIPTCTLKLFPYHYNHVVQYARDLFEGYFNRIPMNYRRAISPSDLMSMTPSDLVQCYDDCMTIRSFCKNFKNCIDFAYTQWHLLFRDMIEQILAKYPENHLDDDGKRFWTGIKKKPHPLKFDSNDSLHMSMIISFANVWADCIGIPNKKRYRDTEISKYKKFIAKLTIPLPKQSTDIEQRNDSLIVEQKTIRRAIGTILKEIGKKKGSHTEIKAMEFEKDDDHNHHIDLITAVSCLRATNYMIQKKDRMDTKKIAGQIIPALASTTSLVSGFVSIELYKIFTLYKNDPLNHRLLERFRTGSFNTALQMFGFAEPYAVKSTIINDKPYNIWTNDIIPSATTFEELIGMYDRTILINHNGTIIEKIPMEIGFITRDQEILYQNGNCENELLERCICDIINENQTLVINLDPLDGRPDFENRTDTMITVRHDNSRDRSSNQYHSQ